MDRLGPAVVVSALAHALLIYGFVLAEGSRSDPRGSVIHARLDVAQEKPDIPSSEAVAPRILRMPGPPALPHSAADEPAAKILDPTQPAAPSSPLTADAGLPQDSAQATAATESVASRSEAEMVAIPDPVHYEARELDIYPRPLRPISPTYPADARDGRVAGSVTLSVMIDEGGRVVSASVVDADPAGVFDRAAEEAVATTAFYPAQRNGRTVRSQMLVKVEFDPRANP
jgi:protein TonB